MKTRYIVAYRLKDRRGGCPHRRRYKSFPNQKAAKRSYDRLCQQVIFRCLSYGFGNVLEQQGRDRDA